MTLVEYMSDLERQLSKAQQRIAELGVTANCTNKLYESRGAYIFELEENTQTALNALHVQTQRAERAEAAPALSREQTEYANDAMMAMCKRAEKAEDTIERLKCCGNCASCDFDEVYYCADPTKEGATMPWHWNTKPSDGCHFIPSRWTERIAPSQT